MAFVSASTTRGALMHSSGTVSAAIGGLNVGEGARVTVLVTATAPGNFVNTAAAASAEPEATPANNTASVAVTITPLVRPVVSIIASNASFYLTWPSATPDVFVIQRATNLTPAITWQTLTNAIHDNGTVKWVLITNGVTAPEHFYRLRKP
jgi:hypothetical protein